MTFGTEELQKQLAKTSLLSPYIQVREVLAYYQRHKDQIDTYLQEQQQVADQIRQELQDRHSDFLANLRQRLRSRSQLIAHSFPPSC